jgi:hypothetical protein
MSREMWRRDSRGGPGLQMRGRDFRRGPATSVAADSGTQQTSATFTRAAVPRPGHGRTSGTNRTGMRSSRVTPFGPFVITVIC